MRKVLFAVFFLIWVSSCKGTDVAGTEIGNARDIGVVVVGIQEGLARVNARTLVSGISLDEAQVVLDQLEFRTLDQCESNGSEKRIHLEGPFVTDLLNNSSIPDLGKARITSDIYCRIELRMAKLEPDQVPTGIPSDAEIIGHSFYLSGTRADSTPFVAKLEQDEEFRIESEMGFDLTDTDLKTLFIAFDLEAWLAGVNLNAAEVATGGVIYIDKDNNSALLDQIKTNIQDSARLFGDQNDNGILEDTESRDEDIMASGRD